MTVPTEVLTWVLGLFGTGILAGIGFILRSLARQNEAIVKQGGALALLVARVGTLNPEVVNQRLIDLETDMARVWGIYDAWKGPHTPDAADRMKAHAN